MGLLDAIDTSPIGGKVANHCQRDQRGSLGEVSKSCVDASSSVDLTSGGHGQMSRPESQSALKKEASARYICCISLGKKRRMSPFCTALR